MDLADRAADGLRVGDRPEPAGADALLLRQAVAALADLGTSNAQSSRAEFRRIATLRTAFGV